MSTNLERLVTFSLTTGSSPSFVYRGNYFLVRFGAHSGQWALFNEDGYPTYFGSGDPTISKGLYRALEVYFNSDIELTIQEFLDKIGFNNQ